MKPLWVGLILLAVILVPNLLAYLIARGAGDSDSKFWVGFESALRQPFHKEDESLDELHRRVGKFTQKKD